MMNFSRPALLGLVLAGLMAASPALAFDRAGFQSRLDATLAELQTKRLADSKATLARLDEMIELGKAGIKEYAAKQPKYAKLMEAVVADAAAMKGMTDPEIEDKWGEKGNGGDAVGVPLKSLDQFGEERAYMELVVGPAHTYLLIAKWQSAQKARWLDQAKDEVSELAEHMKKVQ